MGQTTPFLRQAYQISVICGIILSFRFIKSRPQVPRFSRGMRRAELSGEALIRIPIAFIFQRGETTSV